MLFMNVPLSVSFIYGHVEAPPTPHGQVLPQAQLTHRVLVLPLGLEPRGLAAGEGGGRGGPGVRPRPRLVVARPLQQGGAVVVPQHAAPGPAPAPVVRVVGDGARHAGPHRRARVHAGRGTQLSALARRPRQLTPAYLRVCCRAKWNFSFDSL